jgi:phospho-N-acetylmuramoyl-pentapeptide-transferase
VVAISILAILGYISCDPVLASKLHVIPVAEAAELTVLAGGTVGALLGFLWFNRFPARVFMGDIGSLPLGGLLGFIAVAMRQEFMLAIVGGVFVAEATSVLIQVSMYKWRRRRVFRCAPLHHHFQFQGWPEPKIVARFWMASALLAVLALAIMTQGI